MRTQAQGALGVPQIVTRDEAEPKKGISFDINLKINVDKEVVIDAVDKVLEHCRETGQDIVGGAARTLKTVGSFISAHALKSEDKPVGEESGGLVSTAFSALRGAATLLSR